MALDQVAAVVLGGVEIEGLPCAQVSPAERCLEYPGTAGLFHYAVVNGDCGAVLVYLGDEFLLIRCAVILVSVLEERVDFWQPSFQGLADGGGVPYEDAGVPQEFAAVDKYLGQLPVGLLGEGFYLVCDVPVDGGGFFHIALYVAVAGLRTGGVDSESEEFIAL